ncbi:HlyD family type I secretion periplasmic adaptor subunit [Acuticoccus sp. I52.16.1]|uniref:HlyD family type I secretion periplasmic adaptor subunit n=1 Tax=Acuticoccus sp. I52.16.1 TaxID=2928472 RepID=UPI001FD122A0|nr:HlyD family type I secretion periplasmic adaptor subunit [Acuticoccus sp. I52.16.1]UOM36393.1 HlyD family type I secretion periplasmic adaptor subunit [Acuticoccus sp. I52.16.1]
MALPVKKGTTASTAKPKFSSSIRSYVIGGTVACFALLFGFGGWAATAKLASAVIAGGTVVVASNVKQVQHPDGGIVGEINVADGDRVEAGQLLLRLDETLVAANRALVDGQIVAMEARLARLQAERDDSETIPAPEELAQRMNEPLVKRAMASEHKVFQARKDTIAGQTDRLNERTKQLEQQIEGLRAQQKAKEDEITLIDEELEVLGGLYDRGRTTRDKIVNLRRNRTRLEGERGELVSQIAIAEGKINETELEVLQLTTDRREKTFSEITELEPELANLKERRIAADFQLKRMDIRSPADGTVFELEVHTVGGVVQPAQTIMQIVPQADKLVIESRIATTDVDKVAIGQEATVILSAFDYKTTPQLKGEVSFVAAEASFDEVLNTTFYAVRISLQEGELDRLPEDLVLMPGMPAEIYISTGGQTVVEYLTKPLTQQIRRAWRES